MHFEMFGDSRIGLFGGFPNFGSSDAWFGQQLVVAGDRLGVASFLADPDRKRRSPIPLAGKCPIDIRFEEVPEPALLNMLWEPIDVTIVREHLLAKGGCANEPTLAGVLNQRVFVRSPAEGIVVKVLFLMEQEFATAKLAADLL